MKKLKAWVGNRDGDRAGFIAAYSQLEAIKAIPTGYRDFKEYWHLVTCEWPIKNPEIGALYTRGFMSNGEWVKGLCPRPGRK